MSSQVANNSGHDTTNVPDTVEEQQNAEPYLSSQDEPDPNESILALQKAIFNENFNPLILNYEHDAIKTLQQRITYLRTLISDMSAHINKQQYCALLETDILRTTYMLRQYLRIRLTKIEQSCLFILSKNELRSRLSEAEEEFLKDYARAYNSHLNKQVLKKLPLGYQSSVKSADTNETRDMIYSPDTNKLVVVQALEDVGWVKADEFRGDVQLLQREIQYVQFNSVKDLVDQGKVRLL